MNVYVTSVGCKLNQAEMEDVARRALAAGLEVVEDPAAADWAVVNTCAVTHVAARKCRQLIRGLRRRHPDLRVAVTGCYVGAPDGALDALEGVDLLVPNGAKEDLLDRLLSAAGEALAPQAGSPARGRPPGGHTRAFVKIQDGCDNRCTYCYVRLARGAQRSRAPEDVLAEIRRRLDEGYREVVLTGVHIGAYGRDSAPGAPLPAAAGWSLARLVGEVLARTDVPRLRLSSIEPWDLDEALLGLLSHPRLCRHVHLPVQSGSDRVLRRMGRPYDVAYLVDLAARLRARAPEVSLTTDLMVGFPGETDADAAATHDLAERLALSRLHVFTYSPRPGTPAAEMPGRVAPPVAAARSRALIDLGRRLAEAYHARFVGRTLDVLCETREAGEGGALWSGLSDNYCRVRIPAPAEAGAPGSLANRLVRVRCLAADDAGLDGDLLAYLDPPNTR